MGQQRTGGFKGTMSSTTMGGGLFLFSPWEAKSLPTRVLLGTGPHPKARGSWHSIRLCCLQGTFLQLRHRELAAALLLAP